MSQTRRIVIDCDPGTDDAVAIWMALGAASLDVAAISVAGGNVGLARTLPNALAVAGLAGYGGPVFGGADRPLLGHFTSETRVHGTDGLGGVFLPPGGDAAPGHAVDALRALLRAAAAPVTLVGIAPLTNLALVFATEPALAERVDEVVLMSGAVAEGNITPSAEFNAWNDPEALAVVLGCGRPVRFATLDLTAQALVTPARVAALRARGGGKCLEAACDILAALPPSRRMGGRGAPLHDPCAIAWLLAPELFTTRDCNVAVELAGPGRGRTIADRWGRSGAPVNATLMETLDGDGFFELLGTCLANLP